MKISTLFKSIVIFRKEFCFALLLSLPSLNYYLNEILQKHFGMSSISPLIYIMMAVVGLISYSYIFNGSSSKARMLVIFLFIASILSLIFTGISDIIIGDILNPLESPLLMLYLYCIPAFILGSCINNVEQLVLFLSPLCVCIIIMLIPSYIVILDYGEIPQYMTISYNALLASCFCFGSGVDKRSLFFVVLGLVGFIFIITVGARGAAISSFVFVLIKLYGFIKSDWKKSKKIVIYIFSLLILVLIYIVPILSDQIDSGVIGSRVFSKMEDGDLFVSDARTDIRKAMINGILENPFGYGFWGDKIIFSHNASTKIIAYSHNVVLDFLAYFGVFLGPILFFLILRQLYRRSIPKYNSLTSRLVLIMFPYCFFMLFFSGSISDHIGFFALLGVLFNRYITQVSQTQFGRS